MYSITKVAFFSKGCKKNAIIMEKRRYFCHYSWRNAISGD